MDTVLVRCNRFEKRYLLFTLAPAISCNRQSPITDSAASPYKLMTKLEDELYAPESFLIVKIVVCFSSCILCPNEFSKRLFQVVRHHHKKANLKFKVREKNWNWLSVQSIHFKQIVRTSAFWNAHANCVPFCNVILLQAMNRFETNLSIRKLRVLLVSRRSWHVLEVSSPKQWSWNVLYVCFVFWIAMFLTYSLVLNFFGYFERGDCASVTFQLRLHTVWKTQIVSTNALRT